MPLHIAILEDNLDRRERMKAWLDDRLYMYGQAFFDDAKDMNHWLEQHRGELLAVALDHDLDLKPSGDGRWLDPGTGRMVADYLAQFKPICPVLVHSTNAPAAAGMVAVLQERGWMVDAVTPYADTQWIDESWWPALRRLILSSANRDDHGRLHDEASPIPQALISDISIAGGVRIPPSR